MTTSTYQGRPCQRCGGTTRRKYNADCIACRHRGFRPLHAARNRARHKGIACDLTAADASRLGDETGRPCPACGSEMIPKTTNAPSWDRADNAGGYTAANVRVICRRCNARKGDMTGAELLRLAQYVLGTEGETGRTREATK